MSRYNFGWMAHTPQWANGACSCLTNIFMDAAEGNFNVMNLGVCAMNVQSLIEQAMNFDFEIKTFAPEAIAEYVVAIGEFIAKNEIVIDWNTEDFGQLFMIWGFKEVDLTNVESVYNAIANAWAWNVSMKTGVTLEMFFDIFINVEDYMEFIRLRLNAFGIDADDTFEVAAFISDEKNQNKLLDFKGVDNFVFGFFKDPEFVNKLNVFAAGVNLEDFGFDAGWNLANWVDNNIKNWGEGWTYPSLTEFGNFLNFFNVVVSSNSGLSSVTWSEPFVMNLINCARYEIDVFGTAGQIS